MFKVKVLENGKAPLKAHTGDAGFDCYTTENIILKSNQVTKVPLGFSMEIPDGYMAMIADKSGIASKGVFCVGSIIDSPYRGQVHAVLINNTDSDISFEKHQKIAQVILFPCYTGTEYELVNELSETIRGTGGFGSTGKF